MSKKKALLIRVDRIGDLVLTLPADEVFISKGFQVTWLVNQSLSFVPVCSQPQRKFVTTQQKFRLKEFLDLWSWLRREKFDAAFVFYAPAWVSWLLLLAGIPWRGGRRSQWYSFLLLNKGIRQSRILGEKSELDLNFELAERSLGWEGASKRTSLILSHQAADSRLLPPGNSPRKSPIEKWGLDRYFVVHPGMSGSARNWPSENFVKLILELAQYGRVVITGTQADARYLEGLEEATKGRALWLVNKLDSFELLEVLSRAKLVVAPSTGVVHLAASTGVPTLGIYSPVKSQSAKRWGPRGRKVATLTPQVDCPATKECLGTECRHFDCMNKITVSDLLVEARNLGGV